MYMTRATEGFTDDVFLLHEFKPKTTFPHIKLFFSPRSHVESQEAMTQSRSESDHGRDIRDRGRELFLELRFYDAICRSR